MLLKTNDSCSKCGRKFEKYDTQQSVKYECLKCRNEVILCSYCKVKGCDCGGDYLNFWDKNPGWMI
jgi:hypothetical protein